MASSMIHIAVANEVNKKINRNNKYILIGSIAPDISKLIGRTKLESHFQDSLDNIPNLDKFLKKYKNNLNDDFVLGYYIHLYTDYLWFKYFVPDFYKNGCIYELDGSIKNISEEEKTNYFYNDYTNLNIKLIDEYNLELKIFYEELPQFEDIIKEIPMDKLQLIIDKAGIIIENSKENKAYVFDMNIINKFINTSVEYILSNLKEIGIF
jgi:hypothetical protein